MGTPSSIRSSPIWRTPRPPTCPPGSSPRTGPGGGRVGAWRGDHMGSVSSRPHRTAREVRLKPLTDVLRRRCSALPSPAVLLSIRVDRYYERLRRPLGTLPTSRLVTVIGLRAPALSAAAGPGRASPVPTATFRTFRAPTPRSPSRLHSRIFTASMSFTRSNGLGTPLISWARRSWPGPGQRLWAIEDCRHVSARLERALLTAGEQVRVPPITSAATPQPRSTRWGASLDQHTVSSNDVGWAETRRSRRPPSAHVSSHSA